MLPGSPDPITEREPRRSMPSTMKLDCPSCGVGLRVAEALRAGKTFRCPKCTSTFPVPRSQAPPVEDGENPFEVVDEQPERPRGRRRQPKPAASNAPLVLGLALGGVVLLAGAAA